MPGKTKERPLTILQKAALNAITSGVAKTMTDACRIAGYKGNNNTLGQRASELVRNSKFKAALDEQQAIIRQKTEGIAIDNVLETNKLYLRALSEGNLNVAARMLDQMHKLRGSYTDNKPNPDQLKAKALDYAKSKELREIAEMAIDAKYNGRRMIECTQNATEQPVTDEKPLMEDNSLKEGLEQESTPKPPQGAAC